MGYGNGAPLEAWMFLIMLVCLAILPITVGIIVTKVYRSFHPIQRNQRGGLAAVGTEERDGFFKMAFIGWLACVPLYVVGYLFLF